MARPVPPSPRDPSMYGGSFAAACCFPAASAPKLCPGELVWLTLARALAGTACFRIRPGTGPSTITACTCTVFPRQLRTSGCEPLPRALPAFDPVLGSTQSGAPSAPYACGRGARHATRHSTILSGRLHETGRAPRRWRRAVWQSTGQATLHLRMWTGLLTHWLQMRWLQSIAIRGLHGASNQFIFCWATALICRGIR